jgi:tetratricopeptide (TPR) repeat protein
LALSVTAARASARPRFPLATLASELRKTRTGLDAMTSGDQRTDLRTVFWWSYRSLDVSAARMFRLLGLHPGPEISAPAAASLADVPDGQARPLLAELARSNLVEESSPGRFTLHDLLRGYAAELAHAREPDEERRAAVRRLLDRYLDTANEAATLLYPQRDLTGAPTLRADRAGEALTDADQAMVWFHAEHRVMLAAIRQAGESGFDAHVGHLAWTLVDYLDRQGQWHELIAAQHTALSSAVRSGNRLAEALAHRMLGLPLIRLARYEEAHTHIGAAQRLFGELGDRVSEGLMYVNRSWVYSRQSRYREAAEEAERGLALLHTAGHRKRLPLALNALGYYLTKLEQPAAAVVHCREALLLHEESGDRFGKANTWDTLGAAQMQLGEFEQAVTSFRAAIDLFGQVGASSGQGETLTRLGDAHHATGDLGAARTAWRQALTVLTGLGHPDGAAVRERLAGMPAAPGSGRPAAGAAHRSAVPESGSKSRAGPG